MRYLSIFTFFVTLLSSIQSFSQQGDFLLLQDRGYVDIDSFSTLMTLNKGTISFKVNTREQISTSGNVLFSATNSGIAFLNNNEFYIVQRNNGQLQVVSFKDGQAFTDAYTPLNSLTSGSWHQITVVFDGKDDVEIYIDQNKQPLVAGACCGGSLKEVFFDSIGSVDNMKIGSLVRKDTTFFSNGATIDDFGIWNFGFSELDVISNIANLGHFKTCNLLVYYDFTYKQNFLYGMKGDNDIKDNSGNNHTGDIVAGDIYGTYADHELKLVSGNSVDITNFPIIAALKAGTIGFRFKIKDLSKDHILFGASNEGEVYKNNNDFFINYRNGGYIQNGGIINGVITLDAYTPALSINDTLEHYYSFVSNGSGNVEIYIDGKLQSLSAGDCCNGTIEDFFFADLPVINNIQIGALKRSDTIYYADHVSIDDFTIWNYPLNDAEIAIAKRNKNIAQDCGTVVYFDFNKLEDLKAGFAGTNDYRDFTNRGLNADYINNTGKDTVVTSVTSSYKQQIVELFPNPCKDCFNVKFEGDISEVSILDLYGSKVISITGSNVNSNTCIPVDMLNSGIFIVEINTPTQTYQQKLIKN